MLSVTHSQVDDETEFGVSLDTCVVSLLVISLDSVSLSILASIKRYLAFFKFLETAKDGLPLLSEFYPIGVEARKFWGYEEFLPKFPQICPKKSKENDLQKKRLHFHFGAIFAK